MHWGKTWWTERAFGTHGRTIWCRCKYVLQFEGLWTYGDVLWLHFVDINLSQLNACVRRSRSCTDRHNSYTEWITLMNMSQSLRDIYYWLSGFSDHKNVWWRKSIMQRASMVKRHFWCSLKIYVLNQRQRQRMEATFVATILVVTCFVFSDWLHVYTEGFYSASVGAAHWKSYSRWVDFL